MKPPTNVREVRRFLCMRGFYRKHVPSFAMVATPLTNLTISNTVFALTEECEKSFEHLKNNLVNASILVKFQVNQPFILTTYASDTHVGGVLSQLQSDGANKSVGYFSKKLNPCDTRYSATDKQALAIVLACRNFQNYLRGTRFTVVTDHQPFNSIFKRKTKSPSMNRRILEMRENDYDNQNVKGKDNFVAGHLSRPVRVIVRSPEATWLGLDWESFQASQKEESVWEELTEYLKGGKLPTKRLL